MLRAIADQIVAFRQLIISGTLLLVCWEVSRLGVDYAVQTTHCDTDGGRGGAIAVILAIMVIFFTPSYASRLYKLISKGAKEQSSHTEGRSAVQVEINRLLTLLDEDAKYVFVQNVFLAAATMIGTFYWGFGDKIARSHLVAQHVTPCLT